MAKLTTRVAQAMGWPHGYPISGFGVARRPPNGLGWAAQPPQVWIWGDLLATHGLGWPTWPRYGLGATIRVAMCHPKRLLDLSPSLSPGG
jgi:hypothetical protein